jgi:hypothetical protein
VPAAEPTAVLCASRPATDRIWRWQIALSPRLSAAADDQTPPNLRGSAGLLLVEWCAFVIRRSMAFSRPAAAGGEAG